MSSCLKLAFALGWLCACGSAEQTPAAEPAAAEKKLDDSNPCGAAYPVYSPGMTVEVGALTAKLVRADPSPPRQKVPNSWDIELSERGGAPAAQITLANPDSFMPAHNHHGRTPPSIAPSTQPGRAQVKDIDFSMRGPWQVLFDVHQAGTKVGSATFQVCVR